MQVMCLLLLCFSNLLCCCGFFLLCHVVVVVAANTPLQTIFYCFDLFIYSLVALLFVAFADAFSRHSPLWNRFSAALPICQRTSALGTDSRVGGTNSTAAPTHTLTHTYRHRKLQAMSCNNLWGEFVFIYVEICWIGWIPLFGARLDRKCLHTTVIYIYM